MHKMAEQILSFKCGSSIITQIIPVNEKQCWVKNLSSPGLTLVDCFGNLERNIKCECFRFMVDDDNTIIYTDYPRKKIGKVDEDNEIICLISTTPLCPSLICSSKDTTFLLVAEKDNGAFHKTLLFRYSNKGTLLEQIYLPQELENGVDNIIDLNENENGDIAIVTRGSEEHAVFIISNDGIRTTYKGMGDTEKAFDPVGICWTSDSSLLISDNQNHRIHRLTSDGQFVDYIVVAGVYFPGPLAYQTPNDTLWIGCNDTDVRVMRLHSKLYVK